MPCAPHPNHHLHVLEVQLVFGPACRQPSSMQVRQSPDSPESCAPTEHWKGWLQTPLQHVPLVTWTGTTGLTDQFLRGLIGHLVLQLLNPITQPQETATVVGDVTALPPRCGMSYPWREGERTPERFQPFYTLPLWGRGVEPARSDGQRIGGHGGCVLTDYLSPIFCPNDPLYHVLPETGKLTRMSTSN